MAIHNLYSKRKKQAEGNLPSVFEFDTLSDKLRRQIGYIISDAFGTDEYRYAEEAYSYIHGVLRRELGEDTLDKTHFHVSRPSEKAIILDFVHSHKDIDEVLDAIELCFKYLDKVIRNTPDYKHVVKRKLTEDEAINDLNTRFKESGIGYAYVGEQIIRIDSTFVHEEITVPTIQLLWQKVFKNAADEYLKAHEHYKEGRNKECLNDCLKAFESTMKIICHAKGWEYSEKDTSSALIKICFQNELIPSYLQAQLTALRSVMESGVPTIRNRVGGHGQGEIKRDADDELTRYVLNLTGTNIIYLVEQSGIN